LHRAITRALPPKACLRQLVGADNPKSLPTAAWRDVGKTLICGPPESGPRWIAARCRCWVWHRILLFLDGRLQFDVSNRGTVSREIGHREMDAHRLRGVVLYTVEKVLDGTFDVEETFLWARQDESCEVDILGSLRGVVEIPEHFERMVTIGNSPIANEQLCRGVDDRAWVAETRMNFLNTVAIEFLVDERASAESTSRMETRGQLRRSRRPLRAATRNRDECPNRRNPTPILNT